MPDRRTHYYEGGRWYPRPSPRLEFDNRTGLPKVKEKNMDIKVGEEYERRHSGATAEVVEVTSLVVVYRFTPEGELFASLHQDFHRKFVKVEPDLQVGDVLRRNLVDGDELYVVLGVSAEGFSAESPRGGPMTAALPLAPWWERTDYKVPVLREGQGFAVSKDGWLHGDHERASLAVVFNFGGRLVCQINDNGKQVRLPCPTSKEL